MITNPINYLINSSKNEVKLRTEIHRAMLRREAELGGNLFGEIKPGHKREFFCLDSHTWVWHEEWKNQYGQRLVQTTRYDVRPDGVYKSQEGVGYKKISADEAKNMRRTVELYMRYVVEPLYGYTRHIAS